MMKETKELTNDLIKSVAVDAMVDRMQYLADLNNPIPGIFRIHNNNTANYPNGVYYSGVVMNIRNVVGNSTIWVQVIFPAKQSGPFIRISASNPPSGSWIQLSVV